MAMTELGALINKTLLKSYLQTLGHFRNKTVPVLPFLPQYVLTYNIIKR